MRNRIVTICLPAAGAILLAAASVAPQARALAITHVQVVDVASGRIAPDRTIVIDGDTLAGVWPGGPGPSGAQVVDGRGAFVVPGLWDMHSHVEASGESSLLLYVANGVTGIRDMGSALDVILPLRDATASGRRLGPHIFAAGPILDDAPEDWALRLRVKTADEGRAAVQLLKRRGVDLIKVHDHTPRAAFFAIAEEAQRQRLPLAGHVPFRVTVDEAIEAGQHDFEHLSNLELWHPCSAGVEYRPAPCRPFFERLAQRGIWQTPTLVHMREIGTIGTAASTVSADTVDYAPTSLKDMWARSQGVFATPDRVRALRAAADVGAVVARDMVQAGVPVLAGCDMMVPGFCVHDELAAMVRGGMTPRAALATATINPPRYFGQPAAEIAAGHKADLLLLDANPLADIANTRRIQGVVAAGRLLDRLALDDLFRQAKAAAPRR